MKEEKAAVYLYHPLLLAGNPRSLFCYILSNAKRSPHTPSNIHTLTLSTLPFHPASLVLSLSLPIPLLVCARKPDTLT